MSISNTINDHTGFVVVAAGGFFFVHLEHNYYSGRREKKSKRTCDINDNSDNDDATKNRASRPESMNV